MEARYFRRSRLRQLVKKPLSIYFHLPFCTHKCPYCHFYVIPNRLSHQKLLEEALILEIEKQLPLIEEREIVSIYFGGGTPALFQGLKSLLNKIPRSSDCEITIEANPEDASIELFSKFRSAGINRLSLGVQSLDDRSLQDLERIHNAKKARLSIFEARDAGFENISIDLMIDLPDQTEESLRVTLQELPNLPIQHLSLYNLTIEPHTAFFKRKVQTPNPESSLRFHMMTIEKLEAIGLQRYEISAFSKPGFESKHNLGYWTGREFIGLGPSAFSYLSGERFQNVANLNRYARAIKSGESPVDFREKLSYPKNINELLAVRLRLKEGANLQEFAIDDETNEILIKLKVSGLLIEEDRNLKLTDRGKLFYDTVASEII